MRKCCHCGELFAPTRHGVYRCLPCERIQQAVYRAKRKAAGKPTGGAKMPLEYHRAYGEKYYQRPEVKKRIAANSRERSKDPVEKVKAASRRKARYAVSVGLLIKQPCVVCGEPRSQAHHIDYSKPLDVVWLRRLHHAAEHKAQGSRP